MSAFEADRFNHSRTSPESSLQSSVSVVRNRWSLMTDDRRLTTTFLTTRAKKTLQQFRATAGKNSCSYFHAVIQAGMIQDLHH